MQLKTAPFQLFGITGLLLFAGSFFVPTQSVDIHLHDTYYVLDSNFITNYMSTLLLLLFTLCFFLRRQLRYMVLQWLHVGLTLLSFLVVIYFVYRAPVANQSKMMDWSHARSFTNNIAVVALLLFVLAQVLFLVNSMIGIFKPAKLLQ